MERFTHDFITVIRSAVTNKKLCIEDDFDWNKAYEIAKSNSIVPMLFYYITLNNCSLPDDIEKQIRDTFLINCVISERQKYCIDLLEKIFTENNIDYMLLKGAILKKYYPSEDMRVMGDVDVLVKKNQYPQLRKLLTDAKFLNEKVFDPEIVWTYAETHIEIHLSLFSHTNSDLYGFFGDGWKLAELCNNSVCKYYFSPENELLYLISHLAKHMRNGGAGIRHIVDIWLFQNNNDIDYRILRSKLNTMNLDEFYDKIIATCKMWFEENKNMTDQSSELISNIVIYDGAFETSKRSIMAHTIRISKQNNISLKLAKSIKYFRIFFPKYNDMCLQFPFLKKLPCLLPVFYMVRIVKCVSMGKTYITRRLKDYDNCTIEEMQDYEKFMNNIGLYYSFEEKRK